MHSHPPATWALASRLAGGSVVALTAAATFAALSAASPQARAPRIVAAAMQDADGNTHADRVRLTYSERIRHAVDRDGSYPFRVAGYRIRSVGKASGRTILLVLVEKAGSDDSARPPIRYMRTRSGAVVDTARHQAAAQLFRATRPHGKRPASTPLPEPNPQPQPQPKSSPVADRDADGVVDTQDCGPTDPTIKPGAPDEPDLAFVDSNCDGIDGTEKNAVFASPRGNDANPGTKAAPKREINAAVVAAAAAHKDVYAAAGAYKRVQAVSGVGVYGGYDAGTWKRSRALDTAIVGAPEGVFAAKATKVVLQLLTVSGRSEGPGGSAYGIRAVDGSSLVLQRLTVRAGGGANGAAGDNGSPGVDGGPGGDGAVGSTSCAVASRRPGGAGGDSALGRIGGKGGDGGTGRNGFAGAEGRFGTTGGLGGKGGSTPGNGQDGQDGSKGEAGIGGDGGTSSLALAASTWIGADGGPGRIGGAGNGGGGGGGGGYKKNGIFQSDWPGSGGGGGGGGGGPGGVGQGGRFGGGSFGVYLFASTIAAKSSSITAGDGGTGGRGGNGGPGGNGGAGGRDAGFPCGFGGLGGKGGKGGDGGLGGAGGGGGGGPSIGVMKVGASEATLTDVAIRVGKPGAGGAFGAGGTAESTPAQPGAARDVYPKQ